MIAAEFVTPRRVLSRGDAPALNAIGTKATRAVIIAVRKQVRAAKKNHTRRLSLRANEEAFAVCLVLT
jgi:uncharacterized protein (UPF0261 family)